MIFFDAERPSDSPFVERIWGRSHSEGTHPFLSIAVCRLELVVTKLQGQITLTVRGPETKATAVGHRGPRGSGFESRLRQRVSPSSPATILVDDQMHPPAASSTTFRLGGEAGRYRPMRIRHLRGLAGA